jgi:ribosomal protein L11 methyltransferase
LAEHEITIHEIPYRDWSVEWKDRFTPVEVGTKLIIRAPWHTQETEMNPERIPVLIEPSMAFGTGEHPTTHLCLEAVEQCAGSLHADSLLDVGTGSGILAVSAAKLGFRHVIAIDSDPVAVEIARENFRLNNTPDIVVSGGPLNEVSGTFDVVVGNLTSETIKTLFHDCLKRLVSGGTGIFSGILLEQKHDMLSFFRAQGIQNIQTRQRDGWCGMVLR